MATSSVGGEEGEDDEVGAWAASSVDDDADLTMALLEFLFAARRARNASNNDTR